MSQSAGAGSPLFFHCPTKRQEIHSHYYWPHAYPPPSRHLITLTGRTRPYKPKRYSALGIRSSSTARQWACECGKTGWSNHIDLERMATALSK
jgi:hypothetical protein